MDNFNSASPAKWHWLVKIVAILMLGAIVIVAILRDRIVNNQFRSITVMGQGKVSYAPDTAVVNLGVQIDKVAKAEDAMNQLNAKMAKVIAAIKALGVADENITTQNFYLTPQYDYRPIPLDNPVSSVSYDSGAGVKAEIEPAPAPAVRGVKEQTLTVINYSANQQLIIKIKDFQNNKDLLNKVVGKATEAGANQIQGISFEAANLNDLKQQARVKAIADARGKAQALADAAGVKLKDITGWYENFLKGGYYPEAAMGLGGIGGGGGMTPQVVVGDNEVMVEIGVTYNIK